MKKNKKFNKELENIVKCPRCGSDTYRFGRDPQFRNNQRYQCKNQDCRRQFTPGRPKRPKKYPTANCPKCGGRMSIFKFLSDGYRLRCNNHIRKGERYCNHKMNVPFPGKEFKIAKDPVESIKVNIATKFEWNKMSFTKDTVAYVLYFAIFRSLPATEVSITMQQIFNIEISHDTITRWTHKAALSINKNLGPLSLPKRPGRKKTFTDETGFKVKGQKRWVWLMRESRFDSDQSWFISPKRSTEYARNTFNIAFETSPCLKKATTITDGLWSYKSALGDLDFNASKYHEVYKGFFELPNNNRQDNFCSLMSKNDFLLPHPYHSLI